MRLGFSSLERFTADYKRKVNNARQTAWRDKTTRCRLAEELLSGDEKVQVAVVLSNEAGRRFDYEVEKERDGMAQEIANLIFMVRVYVYNLS